MKDPVRDEGHDGGRDRDAEKNRERGLLNIDLEQRSRKRPCPSPGTRKRNTHEQRKPPELRLLNALRLAQRPLFELSDDTSKELRRSQPVKYLRDKGMPPRSSMSGSMDTTATIACGGRKERWAATHSATTVNEKPPYFIPISSRHSNSLSI